MVVSGAYSIAWRMGKLQFYVILRGTLFMQNRGSRAVAEELIRREIARVDNEPKANSAHA